MDHHQDIENQPAHNVIHLIEDEPDRPEDPASDEKYLLEDALEAWKEINCLVRNIGRSLITSEVAALKRSASEISQRCASQQAALKQGEEASAAKMPAHSPDHPPNKRRRVSGFAEDVQVEKPGMIQREEKEVLMKRMARMRRMNSILVSLNNSHGQLETEIRNMLAEST